MKNRQRRFPLSYQRFATIVKMFCHGFRCDLLRETFDQWKYSHFEIYDEDGNEVNEDLNLQLDEIFEDFLENTSHEPFVREIEKTIA